MPRGRVGQRRRGEHRQPPRRRATVGLVSAITLLLSAHTAEIAHAGTYVMRNCSVPGYPISSLGPWQAYGVQSNAVAVDACIGGGGIGFRFEGGRSMIPGGWAVVTVDRPISSAQREIHLDKLALWYAARLGGSGQAISLYGLDRYADYTESPLWPIVGRPGGEDLTFERRFSRADVDAVSIVVVCGPLGPAPPPDSCRSTHPIPIQVHGLELTLREDVLPTVSPPEGTLLEGGPQSGTRTVTYDASDLQAGLAKVEVLLGDTVVASHDLRPRCAYADFTVCPPSDNDTLAVDTRAVPNGSYDFALRAVDAAGNERVHSGEGSVDVANPASPEAFSGISYAIIAGFKGSSRSTLTATYGRRVSLRGRLTSGSQAVAAGTQIEVLERLDRRGARERSTRKIMTKADGSFSLGIATSRPSRKIRLAYRPVGGGGVVSKAFTLRIRAASSVRAGLRGRVVRFSGRVLGAPFPKRGKQVQMEGRSPGSAWTVFKSLRTDKKGRFSGTYRLRVRRPGVVLKVRAIVPSEAGYGYLSSRSRAVTLRVR
jgi:hypothetical protein